MLNFLNSFLDNFPIIEQHSIQSKLIILLSVCLIAFFDDLLKRYPFHLYEKALKERNRLLEVAQHFPSVIVLAPPRMGKTLLLSIVARCLPQGFTKKLGFASNIPDAISASHND